MGEIRRQTILSSVSTYFGFLVGVANTYLFVHAGKGAFSAAQYGLTGVFANIGQMIYAFASFGVTGIIYKFFPYYKDNLEDRDNDLLAWSLVLVAGGFLLVLLGGWVFEPLVIRKFSRGSALLVDYYAWVFPFGLGLLLFSVGEAYAISLRRSVFSTFLKEGLFRLFTLVLVGLYLLGWVRFGVFIKLFALQYLGLALVLLAYFLRRREFHLSFRVSRVTRRFKKFILDRLYLMYGGVVITIVAQAFDSLLIAGIIDLKTAGIYTLVLNAANIIQVPQRSVQNTTIPHLSQAWKDKDMTQINRIYQRSSINLLILSSGIFCLLWLCFRDAFSVLPIQHVYAGSLSVLLLLGAARIVDSGTGVNGQIIGTSSYWRFEFYTGIFLLALRIPLNIILIRRFGLNGSATADLFSLVAYNGIRMLFLARKFGMQPFSWKSLLVLVYAGAAFFVVDVACAGLYGWAAIAAKSFGFVVLFGGSVLLSRLTPDVAQVWETVQARFRH